jgi:hypothetical protein
VPVFAFAEDVPPKNDTIWGCLPMP